MNWLKVPEAATVIPDAKNRIARRVDIVPRPKENHNGTESEVFEYFPGTHRFCKS